MPLLTAWAPAQGNLSHNSSAGQWIFSGTKPQLVNIGDPQNNNLTNQIKDCYLATSMRAGNLVVSSQPLLGSSRNDPPH